MPHSSDLKSLSSCIKSLSLGWYSQDEILKMSSVEVTLPTSFDCFGHPVRDGPYDLRMGPLNMDYSCETCKLPYLSCPGHYGHYRLSRPVLNPLSFEMSYLLLKSCCLGCYHFKITQPERLAIYTKLKALKRGINIKNVETFIKDKSIEEIASGLEEYKESHSNYEESIHFETVTGFIRKTGAKSTCPRCHTKAQKISKGPYMKIQRISSSGMGDYLTPQVVKDVLVRLFQNEEALISEMLKTTEPGLFFLEVLPIIPNRFRPANFVAKKVNESPLNSHIARMIHASVMCENDEANWHNLQITVMGYFDSSKIPNCDYIGHKQIIEKKEGIFRKNIMGKRVNYAARSVISPDPNLETREIGVPLVFASQLTFPERVTTFNSDKLRQMVINGPEYPGANFIQENNGILTNLKYISKKRRVILANQLMEGDKTVWRHLLDGDPLLVNRQPTLHSASLMGHLTRVLKNEKTLRLHYVNCKSYNADFDGDEMNIHLPQDLNSLSEIYTLALNDNSYIVPSSGQPIRGLTQDHIVAGTVLSMKDSFFTREEYQSLVNSALTNLKFGDELLKRRRLAFCDPCIHQPIPLYTGKQVITTLLKNLGIEINFTVKTKMPDEGGIFRVMKGIVISGVFDKAVVGASMYSLVHACGEIYGYRICNDLLTIFGRMVNGYMLMKGFTIRFDDLLLDKSMEGERRRIFAGNNNNSVTDDLPEDFYFDREKVDQLDKRMRGMMNQVSTEVSKGLETGMKKKYPTNNMMNVIVSGSKGSMANIIQISATLGQQELEGRRVPYMASGKTLPCFKKGDKDPSAGGFVYERFLDGINPGTFFFHCMAGREGLIDTSVKTANSGYLQRCLGKHMEGIYVRNDRKVMNGERIIEYEFGDDGIDVVKGTYLKREDFYLMNRHILLKRCDDRSDGSVVGDNHCDGSVVGDDRSDGSAVGDDRSDGSAVGNNHINNNSTNNDILTFLKDKYINSLASPGLPVGIIAAQSIGEPSTQMTLNTFHLAGVGGRNVTLGIPRLREILMTASKEVKTPMITIPVYGNESKVCEIFRRVTLSECLDRVEVREEIERRGMEYKKHVRILFEMNEGWSEESVEVIDKGFLKQLGKELKKRSSPSGITEEVNENEKNDDKNSDENDDENDDESSDNNTDDHKHNTDDHNKKDTNTPTKQLLNLKRISNRKYAFDIFYPADFNVLLLPIIDGIASKTVVRHVPGFKRATVSSGLAYLEGSNFRSLCDVINKQVCDCSVDNDGTGINNDCTGINNAVDNHTDNFNEKNKDISLDIYNSYSNDIYAITQILGIEAARDVIVKEINAVFQVYGIEINVRHLYLVADYMTKDGKYSAFSRNTFTMDDCFVQKMSFESCFANLKNSAIFNQCEKVESPSSCLMVGEVLKSGTGAFEILYDLLK